MRTDSAPAALVRDHVEPGAPPDLVEVVLVATTGSAEIEATIALIRASAPAPSGLCVTVALTGAAAADREVLERSDPATRFVSAEAAQSAADAWGVGVEATQAPWVLMMSEDIRPEPGWLDRLTAHVAGHPSCVALTPSVCSGAQVGTSNAPAAGHGVCLMVSREALAGGRIRTIDRVLQARVNAAPRSGGSSPTAATTEPLPNSCAPAPGGGAPPGDINWVGNSMHAGATFPDINKRVHLGCGKNHIPGWLNVDGDANGGPDLVADLRNGLPLPDNSVDLIYSEHLFEHCTLDQGMRLFAECLRVLVPGGVIRTAMPNLRDVIDNYLGDWQNQAWLRDFPYIDTPARMLNTTLREWGHVYVYDHEDLGLRLRQTGFVDIQSAEIGRSRSADLCNLETRPESTLVIEATKP